MLLIPAILEKDYREILTKIKKIEQLAELIQIDICDNSLIKCQTFADIEKFGDIHTTSKFELHLMVDEPLIYAKGKINNVASMIMQIEARHNHISEFVATCRENSYRAGLSVLADTPFETVEPYLDMVDFVQFMTIKAGAQGNTFIHSVLDKIREFHKKYPNVLIQSDGGANEQNISELIAAGVTNIAIGAALFRAPMPQNAYLKFKALVMKDQKKEPVEKVEKIESLAQNKEHLYPPAPKLPIKKIAFLGGAGWKENDETYKEAFDVAKLLAENGYEIVNGGGPGVMRASTDGAHAAGGKALAITYHPNKPKRHYEGVDENNHFDEEIITLDYFDRTKVMLQNTDVHIVFRGSIGTLSEFGMTWISSWIHEPDDKPIILYGKFWEGILDAIDEGMLIAKGERRMLQILSTPQEVLDFVKKIDK